jgi:hypothetical protein
MKKEKSEKMKAVVSLPGGINDNSGCCENIVLSTCYSAIFT